ncbi:MAG: ABC transporter permease [Planctomycetes bacterium]|nr:ABC transporter permease [Planctomycetota bacterium]
MHSIWAVARNTLAQAVRMKIAIVVFLLLIILLPLMSVVMGGDGTLLGKLQTFSSYGLGLVNFLLSILTIAISCFTLSNDLKRKHIFLVLTKPIQRFQLILGKLLGVFILNVILLAMFGAVLYGCILFIPRLSEAPPQEVVEVEYEFFTSRIGIKSELDMEALTQNSVEQFNKLKKNNQLPEGMSIPRVMNELRLQEIMKVKSVSPGSVKQWDFENVNVKNPQDPNSAIFVRYKYETSSPTPDGQVYGMWRVGDIRQYNADAGLLTTPIYSVERQEATKTMHEFPVPADAVSSGRNLSVAFFNSPAVNRTTIIPEDIEILYRTGTFAGNYIRATLAILIQLVFLSVLGIALSTCLSFPVAILVCLPVFLVGLIHGFINEAVSDVGSGIGVVYFLIIKPILWLFPQFDGAYNPNGYIIDGRTLSWTFLLMTAGITLFVKGLIAMLIGMFIFSRREVAKAVV